MLIGAGVGPGAPAAAAVARPAGRVVAVAAGACMIVNPNGQRAFVSAALPRLRRGAATLPGSAHSGGPGVRES
jgi:hypothetical protein